MDDPTDNWPDFLPGPRSHLQALGVISLSYGQLEGMFQHLFAEVTGLNRDQVSALFQRIPNNIRENVMLELLRKTTLPKNLKELVQYFSEGFAACAENRHGLVHSSSGGTIAGYQSDHYGFVFTKYSRAGNRLVCTPTLAELRAVAESMDQYALFGGMLAQALNSAHLCAFPVDSTWLPPSLDKPPVPTLLSWREEAEFQASLLPHRPSQA
jgi:hypothetical protein